VLSASEGWAQTYPQSAYLLQEEATAWQKTPWTLRIEHNEA
jgi:exopolyphosphatase/guanosine-5'-triphosphate,3'-diphosphate pyrophosphatase